MSIFSTTLSDQLTGQIHPHRQRERPRNPQSPYAITKKQVRNIERKMRKAYNDHRWFELITLMDSLYCISQPDTP